MNILFLTLVDIKSMSDHGIYHDLIREFAKNDHNIFVVSPNERRLHEPTRVIEEGGCKVLKVRIGNIQKTNLIEKGISTLLIDKHYKAAIKKHFSRIKFQLIIYSTPPITFAKAISYFKKRDNAKTYLLLKDIFPQNAVDLGMFSTKSMIYKYFRSKEKKLYKLSDYIGCMSKANVDYVIKNNPYIDNSIVHVSPNSIEAIDMGKNDNSGAKIRNKYGIPLDKKIFVYGGNLGKPQDIHFIIDCLKANQQKQDRFFVICGTGTEYSKLKDYFDNAQPVNVLLINGLPKDEYENFILSCDCGLIFLDHRFTIPNFPSRLLSYMQSKKPVIACTDCNTDIGKVIADGDFGWWCESNNADYFTETIDKACREDLTLKGENAGKYLIENYTAKINYNIIMNKIHKRIVVNDIAASCGGALSVLQDFYKYIKENDTENEWIFLLGDNYIEETERIKVITLPQVKKSGFEKLKFDFITGKNFIKKLNPDVVFSMQNIITFGLKIPQAVYIHQSIPFQNIKNFSFLKASERSLAIYQHLIGKIIILSAKKSNKVIVQTQWMKKAISDKAKISEENIINTLPHVDDLGKYKKEVRHNRNRNRFFYPTADSIYKNNECIYEACKILNQRGINDFGVKLTIDNTNDTDNIEFIGRIPREQVIDEYNYSTLLFPSYIETFGYPMAEARQMGAIILASNCPFSREVLQGYENAYFFDPFKPKELAALMGKIMNGEIYRVDEDAANTNGINSWDYIVDALMML